MKTEGKAKASGFALAVALCIAVSGVFGASGATGDLLGNIGDVRLKGYLGMCSIL